MKIAGQELAGDLAQLNEEILVLSRKEGQIVLTARAIADMEDFTSRVNEPKPRRVFRKGKGWGDDTDHPDYQVELNRYGGLKMAWIVLKSLEPSQIEWDTVNMKQPASWENWEKDLKANGFTQHECNLVLGLVLSANQLSEAKLERARELFVLGQEEELADSSSQNTEQPNTQSGEHA